ncbi:DUF262 domain-containing protein [Vibrio owensii]
MTVTNSPETKVKAAGLVMPTQIYNGRSRATAIETLIDVRDRYNSRPEEFWTPERMVLGHPLPNWQRPHEWTETQSIRFIESAWLGLHIGTYVVNGRDWDENGVDIEFSGALLDGQQRLTAIELYLDDAFPVFGWYWSQLTRREQRRFERISFTSEEVNIWDEAELRELSDRLAFGGTAHKEEYRATEGYTYELQPA